MEATTKKRKAAPPAPATTEHASPEAKRPPVKSFRIDDVSVSIWKRDTMYKGSMTSFYSFTFERSYKDAAGQWRYTKTFDLDDLGKIASLCQQASEFIASLKEQYAQ